MPTFGQILRKSRKEQGISATEASKLLQITQSTYSKYENDKHKTIPIDLIRKICKYFKTDANTLFLSEKQMSTKNKNVEFEELRFYSCKYNEVIEQFKNCIENTRKLQIIELNNHLDRLNILESSSHLTIKYEEEILYTVDETNHSNFVGLFSIISIVCTEMMKKIKEVANNDVQHYNELISLNVQYKSLLVNILSM